jgi:dTDP-4-amino-4,6-dideoxygalactose transaminase
MISIPFNKPFVSGKELQYIQDVINSKRISGNVKYTNLCHQLLSHHFSFKKSLLTSSCTDALEMAAILVNIQPGDEVILPSYTFVSTANAFLLRGAVFKFVDSMANNPNLDASLIENLITEKTKVIVAVHYAGFSCDMDAIMSLAKKYDLFVVEDAAQAIDNYFLDRMGNKHILGSVGNLGTYSFHETKNINCGEGGALIINDERFFNRAEIIWEKGTNRASYFRGEVDKYNWVDIGSSYLPSELNAAFLYAQLQSLELVQKKRSTIWKKYYDSFKSFFSGSKIMLPDIPSYSTNNAHLFYLVFNSLGVRTDFIEYMKSRNIQCVFHYISLHSSPLIKLNTASSSCPNSDRFTNCLVRLPLYYDLTDEEVDYIIYSVKEFFLKMQ